MKIIIFLMLIFTTNICISDTNIKIPKNILKNEAIEHFKYQYNLIKSSGFSFDNVVYIEVLLKGADEKNIKIIKEKIEAKIKERKKISRYKQIIKNKKIITIIEFNENTDNNSLETIGNIIPSSSEIDSIEVIEGRILKEIYEKITI